MNFPNLSTIPKAFGDALARVFSGTSYVQSGFTLSAHAVGTLQVDVAAGTGFVNGTYLGYAGGSVMPGAASGLPRYDLIVVVQGAVVPSVVAGTAAANPTPPSMANAGDLLLGYVFIDSTGTDYTTTSFISDYTMPHVIAAGTAANPAMVFAAALTTGLFRRAANEWNVAIAAVEKLRLTANGIYGADGAAATVTHGFISDLTLGMFKAAAGIIGFATGGVERVRISSTVLNASGSGMKVQEEGANVQPMTTAGDIPYFTTAPARLPKGTALQVLRMNAGATAPEWAAASGGGSTLVLTTAEATAYFTTNSATFVVITGITMTVTTTSSANNVHYEFNGYAGNTTAGPVNNFVQINNSTDSTVLNNLGFRSNAAAVTASPYIPWFVSRWSTCPTGGKTIRAEAKTGAGTFEIGSGVMTGDTGEVYFISTQEWK